MSLGRIQTVLIATRSGHVVYERFFDRFLEPEKAEIRAAFDDTTADDALVEDQEQVGRHKNGRVVAIPSGELVFYGLGTGEYNELAVSEVLRTLISMYKELFKAALSDVLFFQNYPQIMLVVDEVCKEAGLGEHMDRSSIMRALAFKLPAFDLDDKSKGGGLMSRFST